MNFAKKILTIVSFYKNLLYTLQIEINNTQEINKEEQINFHKSNSEMKMIYAKLAKKIIR